MSPSTKAPDDASIIYCSYFCSFYTDFIFLGWNQYIIKAPGPFTICTTTAIYIIKQLTHGSICGSSSWTRSSTTVDKSPFRSGKGCFQLLNQKYLNSAIQCCPCRSHLVPGDNTVYIWIPPIKVADLKNWTNKFWQINTNLQNLPKFSPSKMLSHTVCST